MGTTRVSTVDRSVESDFARDGEVSTVDATTLYGMGDWGSEWLLKKGTSVSEETGQNRTKVGVGLHPRQAKMLAALIACEGRVSLAAKLAGLKRRTTHYDWLRNDPAYAAALAAAEEEDIEETTQDIEERAAEYIRQERARFEEKHERQRQAERERHRRRRGGE